MSLYILYVLAAHIKKNTRFAHKSIISMRLRVLYYAMANALKTAENRLKINSN